MGAFDLLGSFATSTFQSTAGFSVQALESFATSSVLNVYLGSPFVFLSANIQNIVAYGIIALVLLLPASAFVLYNYY
jgi:hypothetical protein